MKHNFVNRYEELKWLSALDKEKRSQFIVIYGRRRTGKTELIQQFIKGKPSLYYLSSKGNLKEQLGLLAEKCAQTFNDPYLKENPFQNWPAFFTYLGNKIGNKRFYVIFDEFPYLVKADPGTPSQFQKFWDEDLKNKNIFLILLGSSISMIYSSVLSYSSPLYGRRTGQWKLKVLDFWNYKKFLKGKSAVEAVNFFAATDGVPFYVLNLDPGKSFEENVIKKIARPGHILYEEGEILVKEELGDIPTYFSILEAISRGKTTIGEISNFVGMPAHTLTRYMKKLLLTELVIKEIPPTEKLRSKRGIYELGDNFLSFWFRFIYPYKKDIESLDKNLFVQNFKQNFNTYLGKIFEKISRSFLEKLNRTGRLPFRFLRGGRWWHKDTEIDFVALAEKEKKILFGEFKWRAKVNPDKLLNALKEKSKKVEFHLKKRSEYFVIIAKSFKYRIKQKGVLLFDLHDLILP